LQVSHAVLLVAIHIVQVGKSNQNFTNPINFSQSSVCHVSIISEMKR